MAPCLALPPPASFLWFGDHRLASGVLHLPPLGERAAGNRMHMSSSSRYRKTPFHHIHIAPVLQSFQISAKQISQLASHFWLINSLKFHFKTKKILPRLLSSLTCGSGLLHPANQRHICFFPALMASADRERSFSPPSIKQ